MRAETALGQQRGIRRLDADDLDALLLLLQVLRSAGDGATGADARDEDVDLAVGVLKDLRTRGLVVLLRVGLVLELASQDGILGGLNQLVSLIDRTLHAGGSRGEHELGTKGAQHDAALVRHRLWHREHDLVTTCCTNHGQCDTGVAGGCLDNGAARLELASVLGSLNNSQTDAVLHGVSWVGGLDLQQHISLVTLGELIELDQRGIADELGDVFVNLRHFSGLPFLVANQPEIK